jgi:hypothetical protein
MISHVPKVSAGGHSHNGRPLYCRVPPNATAAADARAREWRQKTLERCRIQALTGGSR